MLFLVAIIAGTASTFAPTICAVVEGRPVNYYNMWYCSHDNDEWRCSREQRRK